MEKLSISLIYIAFFTLIGYACYLTNSATPLWALLLTPKKIIKQIKKIK